MPKVHIISINDTEEKHKELLGDLLLVAKKLAREQEIGDGYKLSFNVGKKGGQLVNHLHLHLMGGWE
jgi:histidine triad (HIT) family protein